MSADPSLKLNFYSARIYKTDLTQAPCLRHLEGVYNALHKYEINVPRETISMVLCVVSFQCQHCLCPLLASAVLTSSALDYMKILANFDLQVRKETSCDRQDCEWQPLCLLART